MQKTAKCIKIKHMVIIIEKTGSNYSIVKQSLKSEVFKNNQSCN